MPIAAIQGDTYRDPYLLLSPPISFLSPPLLVPTPVPVCRALLFTVLNGVRRSSKYFLDRSSEVPRLWKQGDCENRYVVVLTEGASTLRNRQRGNLTHRLGSVKPKELAGFIGGFDDAVSDESKLFAGS
jgi:hypothetical protein